MKANHPAQYPLVITPYGCWQELPQRRDAAIIGSVSEGRAHVVLETELGGERMLEELEDDPLPRIC